MVVPLIKTLTVFMKMYIFHFSYLTIINLNEIMIIIIIIIIFFLIIINIVLIVLFCVLFLSILVLP
jgi:hypothetical protein